VCVCDCRCSQVCSQGVCVCDCRCFQVCSQGVCVCDCRCSQVCLPTIQCLSVKLCSRQQHLWTSREQGRLAKSVKSRYSMIVDVCLMLSQPGIGLLMPLGKQRFLPRLAVRFVLDGIQIQLVFRSLSKFYFYRS